MERVFGLAACLVLAGGLAACSDDDNNNNEAPRLDFGEGSAKFAGLSESEKEHACQEVDDYWGSIMSKEEQDYAACTLVGVFSAAFSSLEDPDELHMMCVMARDECLNEASEDEASEEEESCWALALNEDNCTATNDEMEACIEDQVQDTKAMFEVMECEGLLQEEEWEEEEDWDEEEEELSAPCQVIQEKCPIILESDD